MAELSFTYAVRSAPARPSALRRFIAARSARREVVVSDERLALPVDGVDTMIEVDPGEVMHVSLDERDGALTAVVTTSAGTARLHRGHFDGEAAFEDCLEAIMHAAQAARGTTALDR